MISYIMSSILGICLFVIFILYMNLRNRVKELSESRRIIQNTISKLELNNTITYDSVPKTVYEKGIAHQGPFTAQCVTKRVTVKEVVNLILTHMNVKLDHQPEKSLSHSLIPITDKHIPEEDNRE